MIFQNVWDEGESTVHGGDLNFFFSGREGMEEGGFVKVVEIKTEHIHL